MATGLMGKMRRMQLHQALEELDAQGPSRCSPDLHACCLP